MEHDVIRGRMSLMADNPYWWVLPFSVTELAGISEALPFFISSIHSRSVLSLLGMLILAVFSFVAQLFFISAKSGTICEYEADEEKLLIRRAKKPEERFYYTDIRAIRIEPFIMATVHCGYKVTIETDFTASVLYYAFGGPHDKTPPEETPFALLAKRIPENRTENETVSANDYRNHPC